MCKCMSWKRQTSSIQQPQHLSAPTLPFALGNLLTYLQQRARSPANPMSLPVAPSLPSCHLQGCSLSFPTYPSTAQPLLPANLHTKHNISSSVKILLWLYYPEPQSPANTGETETLSTAAAHRNCLTTCITASYCPSEADSPSHYSPSFSKVRFNYWVI